MSDGLLRLDEVKRRSGYSTSALYRAMAAGEFPRPRKRGTQSVWVESEVQAAIDRNTARATEVAVQRILADPSAQREQAVLNHRHGKKPTCVYRHFNAAGELLYVGISVQSMNRLLQHSQNAAWFCEVVRIEIEWFPTRLHAAVAEKRAILAERPRYNTQGAR